mmetsp:Transcript_87880/g.121960  ORF Transcript_87880/g.121960 Transcript_87880/m.121960 type:complete len:182 (-) Transcript_87880:10-555(-)
MEVGRLRSRVFTLISAAEVFVQSLQLCGFRKERLQRLCEGEWQPQGSGRTCTRPWNLAPWCLCSIQFHFQAQIFELHGHVLGPFWPQCHALKDPDPLAGTDQGKKAALPAKNSNHCRWHASWHLWRRDQTGPSPHHQRQRVLQATAAKLGSRAFLTGSTGTFRLVRPVPPLLPLLEELSPH